METQTVAAGPTVAERPLEKNVLHLEQKLEFVVEIARRAVAEKLPLTKWLSLMADIEAVEKPAELMGASSS